MPKKRRMTMKPNTNSKYLSRLALCLILSMPLASIGYCGGSEGGGNLIESAFKSRALALVDSTIKFLEPAQERLKFDPYQLKAKLTVREGFMPLCADNATVARMKGKMAMVFADQPNVVRLDCTHYTTKQWQEILNSSKDEDAVFILHEALRVAGSKNENSYGDSSSYLRAKHFNDELNQKLLRSVVYSGPAETCQLHVHKAAFGDTLYLNFWVPGRQALKYNSLPLPSVATPLSPSEFRMTLVQAFENPSDSPHAPLVDMILKLARDHDCWPDVIRSQLTQKHGALGAQNSIQPAAASIQKSKGIAPVAGRAAPHRARRSSSDGSAN
jgi:hypothetical protein